MNAAMQWATKTEALTTFVAPHPHARVPWWYTTDEGIQLGRFVISARLGSAS